MDEKDFKKHLQDLAHGHHHPEEHDWDINRKPTVEDRQQKRAEKPKRKRTSR